MDSLDNTASEFNRTPIYLALILAVVAVLGAIVGARVVFERAANQPVTLSTIDAPEATSAACTALLERLPGEIGDYSRADLADPAPAGAVAWARTSQDRVTLRCGVHSPEQYTRVSTTETIDGVRWLQVSDSETDLSTWYAVDRGPTVAITAEGFNPTEAVSAAVADLPEQRREPRPLPLDDTATPEGARCARLMNNLPEKLGDHALHEKTDAKAVWTAPGGDPIDLACGVDMPAAYEAGEQLTQIDEIPWLNDNGVFYGLGREAIVAASIPPSVGNTPLVELSAAMTANLAAAE
ncbi:MULTISPECIES: DUF3515 domain-containing protein [unclassified Corynebacterium]|uniref:DUF3515 domain-containing protein n=1 Tax=unclassified Corynebacterium TaxID=2624378 RepID=UPI0029CA1036|nr:MULTISPECIES: DUF3515 domain-containing protein [unclassified Corynebacterium]WPF67079.1 DUF3515 domain-containing protein [Corynebacterium sp. 22KM0430]WPF69567.1 DUF3515 domain-containing protein [Corynebacterium sp. 21KM1197]